MNTKYIFFDIDGTLLDEQTHTIPTSAKESIQIAQSHGHRCFINTGRVISTIDRVITEIPFDGYICGCGTYIEYHQKQIYHHSLSQNVKEKVITYSQQFHIDTVLEGKNGAYFPTHIYHPLVKEIKDNYLKEGFPIGTYQQSDQINFDKFTSWYTDISDIDAFKRAVADEFEIIQRDIDFVECVPHHHSKATGIQLMVDFLGATLDHTISIGDSTNDLSMLTYTKESVAMGNANPLLFNEVTYITTKLQNDGIYNALKHFKMIR